jgi:two-component system LytT family response regulator
MICDSDAIVLNNFSYCAMRILIVEDDISFRRTLAAVVARTMPIAELDVCASVAEAKKMLQSFPTDIVLLDMMLPGGNGIDVLRAFPNPEFSVVCMTAQEFSLPLQQEVLAHGVAAMLWKPFEAEELQETLRHIVKMRLKALNKPIGAESANAESEDGSALHIPTKTGVEYVAYEDIICLEADNNYTIVHRVESKPLILRGSLTEYAQRLPSSADFFFANRSYIVGKRYIREVDLKTRKITLTEKVPLRKSIVVTHSRKNVLREWRNDVNGVMNCCRLYIKNRGGGGQ